MKTLAKPVEVIEVENDGLISLLGESVIVYSLDGYIYGGTLVGVNETFIKLENPIQIMETGDWATKTYKDAQKLPGDFGFHQISSISYFGRGK